MDQSMKKELVKQRKEELDHQKRVATLTKQDKWKFFKVKRDTIIKRYVIAKKKVLSMTKFTKSIAAYHMMKKVNREFNKGQKRR
jgi:hypothetical protein